VVHQILAMSTRSAENHSLKNNLSNRAEEKRLEELYSYNILDTGRDDDFDALATLAAKICGTAVAQINFIDEDSQWSKACIGAEMDRIPREHSFCDHTIRHDEDMIVPDMLEDERFKGNLFVENDPNVRFYAGIAIKSENRHNIGTICVIDVEPKELNEHQLDSLKILAKEIEVRLKLRKTNLQLEESNQQLNQTATFLKNSADLMFLIDPKLFKIREINRDVIKLLGYHPHELQNQPLSVLKPGQVFLEELNHWAGSDLEKFEFECRLQSKNGDKTWFNVQITKVDELWYATARQIEKRKEIEEKHRDTLKILKNAQRIAKVGNWVWYPQTGELNWSDEIHHLMGTDPDSYSPSLKSFMQMIPEEDRHILENTIERIIGGGSIEPFEHRVVKKDGQLIYVTQRGEIERNEHGEAVKVIGILQDITESKQAEEKILESLKEKEVMLAEIHHRVKNNLSIIIGMLQLEEFNTDNLQASEIMNSIISRIRSMALVHENLYQTSTFTYVPFDKLIEDLIKTTLKSNHYSNNPNIVIEADDVCLNINQAIPFALAVNQLIYLCFSDYENQIIFSLIDKDQSVELRIQVDGESVFSKLTEKESNSVNLFKTLLTQFKGSYMINNSKSAGQLLISFDKSDNKGSSAGNFSG
jgi:PAS domain S-box-containing protein